MVPIGHFRVLLALPLFQNESKSETIPTENKFDLHENEPACRTHFYMKGYALRLVLEQRHKIGNSLLGFGLLPLLGDRGK